MPRRSRCSFREHEPSYTPQAFDLATPRKHEIENRIREWAAWVAIHRNEIVGTISAHSEGFGITDQEHGCASEHARSENWEILAYAD